MDSVDLYPHESEIKDLLEEWASWMDVPAGRVGGGCPLAWDDQTIIDREARSDKTNFGNVASQAERTDRALRKLKAQAPKQLAVLKHYHLHPLGEAHRSLAAVARVHHREVPQLLRFAHESFYAFRKEISINPAPALAYSHAAAC